LLDLVAGAGLPTGPIDDGLDLDALEDARDTQAPAVAEAVFVEDAFVGGGAGVGELQAGLGVVGQGGHVEGGGEGGGAAEGIDAAEIGAEGPGLGGADLGDEADLIVGEVSEACGQALQSGVIGGGYLLLDEGLAREDTRSGGADAAAVDLGGRRVGDDGGAQIVQGGRFAQHPHLGGEEAAQVDGEGDGSVEGGEVRLQMEEEMPGGIEAGAIGAGEAGQSGFGEGDVGIGLERARRLPCTWPPSWARRRVLTAAETVSERVSETTSVRVSVTASVTIASGGVTGESSGEGGAKGTRKALASLPASSGAASAGRGARTDKTAPSRPRTSTTRRASDGVSRCLPYSIVV
ncbi:MAG: hypothetical protein M1546_13890, partial [Chloroflexi bacterium]|nr:hypothetical protein [Chloroflexota bacterium]